MQPTPRHRVLSDKIPRVLVFVYFYRGLLGNMEERPTRRVYIEILTCAPIFYHLEDSKSHGNEREAERARGQGARPPPLGARPTTGANQAPPRGSCSTENRVIKVGLIRRSTFIWKGYISRPPGPWRTYLFYRIKARVSIIHPCIEDPSSSSSSSSSSS